MTEDMSIRSLAIVPRTIDECTDLAERLSKSSLLPKAMQGKMPDVLVTILAGQEMGFAPMASLRAIHVIEGKPILSADGMVALVLGSGKAVYFDRIEESETSVTYETLRQGSKTPRRCTWTMAMAKVAGLHLKDNWRGYPRAMLASRAKAELARDVYPDVLAGCSTQDEVDHERAPYVAPARTTPEVIDDAVIVENPTADVIARIAAATSVDALKACAEEIRQLKLTGESKTIANDAYKARMDALKAGAA